MLILFSRSGRDRRWTIAEHVRGQRVVSGGELYDRVHLVSLFHSISISNAFVAIGSALHRLDCSFSSTRTVVYSSHITPRLSKIYTIAGKIVRQVQSSKIEDPSKDDQMSQTVHALDLELAEWVENLPHNVRYATNDRKNPKMLALCLIAFFVYYSAIINLRTCTPPFLSSGFADALDVICRSPIYS